MGAAEPNDERCECACCGGRIAYPNELSGMETSCPHCGSAIVLPIQKAVPVTPLLPCDSLPEERAADEQHEWVDEELHELQQQGLVKKRIPPAKRDTMLKVQAEQEYDSVMDLLTDEFPELLTAAGKRELIEEDRTYREIRQMGEYAPPIEIHGVAARPADEPLATERQIAFLRDLGVRDEALLKRLGKAQASAVIEKVLEIRERKLGV